jgi:hypothetical protein
MSRARGLDGAHDKVRTATCFKWADHSLTQAAAAVDAKIDGRARSFAIRRRWLRETVMIAARSKSPDQVRIERTLIPQIAVIRRSRRHRYAIHCTDGYS